MPPLCDESWGYSGHAFNYGSGDICNTVKEARGWEGAVLAATPLFLLPLLHEIELSPEALNTNFASFHKSHKEKKGNALG
jgi:hypothetical protein